MIGFWLLTSSVSEKSLIFQILKPTIVFIDEKNLDNYHTRFLMTNSVCLFEVFPIYD